MEDKKKKFLAAAMSGLLAAGAVYVLPTISHAADAPKEHAACKGAGGCGGAGKCGGSKAEEGSEEGTAAEAKAEGEHDHEHAEGEAHEAEAK
jgi:hypothetical protein